jgi:hypothetical protein
VARDVTVIADLPNTLENKVGIVSETVALTQYLSGVTPLTGIPVEPPPT